MIIFSEILGEKLIDNSIVIKVPIASVRDKYVRIKRDSTVVYKGMYYTVVDYKLEKDVAIVRLESIEITEKEKAEKIVNSKYYKE